MKNVAKNFALTVSALAMFAAIGCTNIRDYSVASYQGVLPVNDFRPTVLNASKTDATVLAPNPSVPAAPPTADPAAAKAPASEPAKPAEPVTPPPADTKAQ